MNRSIFFICAVMLFSCQFAVCQITSAPYRIGDYYNDGTKEGVVFEVDADGYQGKILSMKQSATKLQWSSDSVEQKRLIGTNNKTDGAYNMTKVKAIPNWQSKYPAFKWCADLGEGWYLPSLKELMTIHKTHLILKKNTNNDKLNQSLIDTLSDYYWSSTEPSEQSRTYPCVCAFNVRQGGIIVPYKNDNLYVRAVSTFTETPKDTRTIPEKPQDGTISKTSTQRKTYYIGDYYNENGKQGVVFEVSADGKHGKIVSMKQSTEKLRWSSDSIEQKRLIGTDSQKDGVYNMTKVKAIPDWQSKYPAFKWCADLGEGWYLPSREELKAINRVKQMIDAKLIDKLQGCYWSSTEYNGSFAWLVLIGTGDGFLPKNRNDVSVRAISVF